MDPKKIRQIFAFRLRYLLVTNRVTIARLAKETGIHSRNINRYLAQECMVSIDTLIKIADYFNVTLDYLVGCESSKNCQK